MNIRVTTQREIVKYTSPLDENERKRVMQQFFMKSGPLSCDDIFPSTVIDDDDVKFVPHETEMMSDDEHHIMETLIR